MIWLLIAVGVVLLMAGPLRKRFLAAWRFTLPAVASGILGFVLAGMFVKAGAPAWMMIVGPVIAALMIGGAGKKWFDDNVG